MATYLSGATTSARPQVAGPSTQRGQAAKWPDPRQASLGPFPRAGLCPPAGLCRRPQFAPPGARSNQEGKLRALKLAPPRKTDAKLGNLRKQKR